MNSGSSHDCRASILELGLRGRSQMCADEKVAVIRQLNDELRRHGRGGRVMVTSGIQGLGEESVRRVLVEVAGFDEFTPDNDPYQEHDCAVMTVDEIRIIWKIDYYDESMRYASPDASDPKLTRRVLTVMLASEY